MRSGGFDVLQRLIGPRLPFQLDPFAQIANVRLKASDEFELSAYVARPSGTPIAGLVVIQEIYGVNGHIRRVGFATDGFW